MERLEWCTFWSSFEPELVISRHVIKTTSLCLWCKFSLLKESNYYVQYSEPLSCTFDSPWKILVISTLVLRVTFCVCAFLLTSSLSFLMLDFFWLPEPLCHVENCWIPSRPICTQTLWPKGSWRRFILPGPCFFHFSSHFCLWVFWCFSVDVNVIVIVCCC